jgi:phosphoribosylanthranilate isomerase
MIKTITVTGADDSVKDIEDLFDTTAEYPLVEWGILLSKSSMGRPRFPSYIWLNRLADACFRNPNRLNLSAHICGRWVREMFFEGKTEIFDLLPMHMFKRIQFNFHAREHKVNKEAFKELLRTKLQNYELIFQFDGVNDKLIAYPILYGIKAYCLYDKSGGAGIVPKEWPRATRYSGYAGGLSPENVVKELERINKARNGHPVWIDAETKLRSEDDKVFQLDKVKEFLKQAYPWIIHD